MILKNRMDASTNIVDKYPANTDNAYVSVIFNGDKYVPGALALAQSLINVKSENDRVCMYTSDVSNDSINKLKKFFTHVIMIDEITISTIPMKSEKQIQIYSWISKSFTKWNCLQLEQYKKILYCDADLIFIENCDELFELKPPAATFSNPWAGYYLKHETREDTKKRNYTMKHPYIVNNKEPAHGEMMDSSVIMNALHDSFVVFGSLVLLRPSSNHFGLFMRWIIGSQPYGHKGISGFDEQSLTEFYIVELKRKWQNIHQLYNFSPRKDHWLLNNEKPKTYHYIGSNPWEHPRELWEDTKKWWETYDMVLNKLNEIK